MENLVKLDDGARVVVESNIDAILKDPKKSEKVYRREMIKLEMKQTHETIMCYAVGQLIGLVAGYYIDKHHRNMNLEEYDELLEILKRRASEIKFALLTQD